MEFAYIQILIIVYRFTTGLGISSDTNFDLQYLFNNSNNYNFYLYMQEVHLVLQHYNYYKIKYYLSFL